MLSFLKRLFVKEKKINLKGKIIVREMDHSEYTPKEGTNSMCGIISTCTKGPTNKLIFLGSTIPKPRWWEIWRWYLIPRYNKESREAKKKFLEIFGKPCTEEDKEKAFD